MFGYKINVISDTIEKQGANKFHSHFVTGRTCMPNLSDGKIIGMNHYLFVTKMGTPRINSNHQSK